MLKIVDKIGTKAVRYLSKNTVRANYNKTMDATFFLGLSTCATGVGALSGDIVCTASTLALANCTLIGGAKALFHRIQMQPIRNRALRIKKAAKLAQKLDKNV